MEFSALGMALFISLTPYTEINLVYRIFLFLVPVPYFEFLHREIKDTLNQVLQKEGFLTDNRITNLKRVDYTNMFI